MIKRKIKKRHCLVFRFHTKRLQANLDSCAQSGKIGTETVNILQPACIVFAAINQGNAEFISFR